MRLFAAHAFELRIVFLLSHELTARLAALRVMLFAHHLGLELTALAHSAVAVAVSGRWVRGHMELLLRYENAESQDLVPFAAIFVESA